MATYLITGVAGFIGSTLARAVLAQGGLVRGLDNFSTGKRENLADIQDRIVFTQMLKGEQPTIFGDGKQSRDFTYVDDVAEANMLACGAEGREVAGRVFNVATGRRTFAWLLSPIENSDW